MTNATPTQPQGNPPAAPSTGPAKKRSPLVWVLAGCAAILVIGGIVTTGLVWWGYHKAKNYVNKELDSTLGNMKTVSQLWSDVPQMDGMTPTQNDMPMPVKLLARAILGNLGRLNKPGEDQTTGDVDWIVLTGSRSPDELKGYYTPEKMADHGWDKTDKSCLSGSEQGFPLVGAFCVFSKQEDGKNTQLAIIAWQESGSKETDVFYLRLTPDKQGG